MFLYLLSNMCAHKVRVNFLYDVIGMNLWLGFLVGGGECVVTHMGAYKTWWACLQYGRCSYQRISDAWSTRNDGWKILLEQVFASIKKVVKNFTNPCRPYSEKTLKGGLCY